MNRVESISKFAKICFASVAVLAATALYSHAAVVHTFVFDLTNAGVGFDLDSGSGPGFHTDTSSALSDFTISVAGSTANVNATVESLGINHTGAGDDTDQIDNLAGAETLIFTLTAPTLSSQYYMTILSIDFFEVGPSVGDAALVSVDGGSDIILETGATDFNGSSDVWTPTITPFGYNVNSTITFTAQTSYGLQGITFAFVEKTPEPGTLGLFALGLGLICATRKNKLSA